MEFQNDCPINGKKKEVVQKMDIKLYIDRYLIKDLYPQHRHRLVTFSGTCPIKVNNFNTSNGLKL